MSIETHTGISSSSKGQMSDIDLGDLMSVLFLVSVPVDDYQF